MGSRTVPERDSGVDGSGQGGSAAAGVVIEDDVGPGDFRKASGHAARADRIHQAAIACAVDDRGFTRRVVEPDRAHRTQIAKSQHRVGGGVAVRHRQNRIGSGQACAWKEARLRDDSGAAAKAEAERSQIRQAQCMTTGIWASSA